MTDRVVIIGAGNYASTVHAYLSSSDKYEVVAFAAHPEYIKDAKFLNLPVVRIDELPHKYNADSYRLFSAFGPQNMNKNRIEIYNDCKKLGYSFITYVDPRASVWSDMVVGENVLIDDSSVIQPHVEIGNNVVLISTIAGHHVKIKDHSFLSRSTLGGSVTIGEGCFLGMNSVIKDGVNVGPYCVVGMAANVRKDLGAYMMVYPPKCRIVSIADRKVTIVGS